MKELAVMVFLLVFMHANRSSHRVAGRVSPQLGRLSEKVRQRCFLSQLKHTGGLVVGRWEGWGSKWSHGDFGDGRSPDVES